MEEVATIYSDTLISPEQGKNPWDHPVGQRIQFLRENWQAQGLPENWYDLPRTGFWIQQQMDKLLSQWTTGDLSEWLVSDARPNVQGYTLEHLAKKGVFPIAYDIHKQHDGAYLTAPMYGGARLLDVINPMERNGALVAVLNEITAFFADSNTPEGSLAVITSVRGPSNIFDPDTGKEIIFPDSQRYILQKQGESIVGFTIRTDALYSEERAFIQALTGILLPESAKPEDYVRAVACIRADDTSGKPKTFEAVVQLMQQTHGRSLAFVDKKGETRITWDDIYEDLQRQDLWDFPHQTGKLFTEFQEFAVLVNRYISDETTRLYARRLLQEGLAATILEIAHLIEGERRQGLPRRSRDATKVQASSLGLGTPSYGNTIAIMQATGGCSNTGEDQDAPGLIDRVQQFLKSLNPRSGTTEEDAGPDGLGPQEFACDGCGGKNTRPLGDYCKICAHCGKEFKPC